jgi:radical S-adenosyl methionine domain-containing protein 2
VDKICHHGFALRINTVVSALNINEDLTSFIIYALPEKWKIFQCVSVDGKAVEFSISNKDFARFCKFHKDKIAATTASTYVFCASAAFIKGSCTMIDRQGQFFDIASGTYKHSESILEVGVERAFAQVTVNETKFLRKMLQVI